MKKIESLLNYYYYYKHELFEIIIYKTLQNYLSMQYFNIIFIAI